MKKQIKVRYCKYGLANFYGDYIEINKKLKYNKSLRDYIIKHELGHSNDFDLNYEFNDGIKLITKPYIALSLLRLYITTPSTWVDLLPIQYKNKKIIYDLNLLILYLFITGLISLIIFIF
jgi:hypothetical protein